MTEPVRRPVLVVVDDDSEVLQALQDLLAHTLPVVEVLTFQDPQQALDMLRHRRIDVIVADYRMGPFDGLELLRRARAVAPQATRILATAYPSRLGAADADVVLVKPLDTLPFVERVRALLGLPA